MSFFLRYKKIFFIAGFTIFVILCGYLLYTIFFASDSRPSTDQPQPTSTSSSSGFPVADPGSANIIDDSQSDTELPTPGKTKKVSEIARGGTTKTQKLNEDPSFGVTLDSNGSSLKYYNKNDGKFYKIDKNGNKVLLADKVFHDVENITWSSRNKAILEYPDGANIVYDFESEKQVTLPKHWEDFDFSPDGGKIAMKSIGLDPKNRWLAVSNDDGNKVRAIEDIGLNASMVYPSWQPNNQSVAMYIEGVGFNRQEVFFIGQNKENFKSTIIEGRGFQPKWSPNGDRLLYSVYSSDNDLKPLLWVVNAVGNEIGTSRKNLNLETWAEKCTFGGDTTVYCAVPESLQEGAGLFPELTDNTKDNLYSINTQTGSKKLVAVPDGAYNMSNLVVSENGYYLYFVDNFTEAIHQVKLK